jgi:hypothetical protein
MAPKSVVWDHTHNSDPTATGANPEQQCNYCSHVFRGKAGATRIKEHLLGIGNNVVHCPSIPAATKRALAQALAGVVPPKAPAEAATAAAPYIPPSVSGNPTVDQLVRENYKKQGNLTDSWLAPEARQQADTATARMLYETGMPLSCRK